MNDTNTKSFLTFKLNGEVYAVDVMHTLKIQQISSITPVPNSPKHIKGVINHHGNVLPVVDLNETFGKTETVHTKNTCIIVLDINIDDENISVGVIVDEVMSVKEIGSEQISPPPSLGKSSQMVHISGVFKENDQFIMILNLSEIFDNSEIAESPILKQS